MDYTQMVETRTKERERLIESILELFQDVIDLALEKPSLVRKDHEKLRSAFYLACLGVFSMHLIFEGSQEDLQGYMEKVVYNRLTTGGMENFEVLQPVKISFFRIRKFTRVEAEVNAIISRLVLHFSNEVVKSHQEKINELSVLPGAEWFLNEIRSNQ